jgi:phosphohistidine phosphatase
MSDAGHRPTLLLVSPARRTRQTAELLAAEFQLPAEALRCVDDLYNAGPATLLTELRDAAATKGLTVLVAHNPGVSNLARELARDPEAPLLKTAEWRALPLR